MLRENSKTRRAFRRVEGKAEDAAIGVSGRPAGIWAFVS